MVVNPATFRPFATAVIQALARQTGIESTSDIALRDFRAHQVLREDYASLIGNQPMGQAVYTFHSHITYSLGAVPPRVAHLYGQISKRTSDLAVFVHQYFGAVADTLIQAGLSVGDEAGILTEGDLGAGLHRLYYAFMFTYRANSALVGQIAMTTQHRLLVAGHAYFERTCVIDFSSFRSFRATIEGAPNIHRGELVSGICLLDRARVEAASVESREPELIRPPLTCQATSIVDAKPTPPRREKPPIKVEAALVESREPELIRPPLTRQAASIVDAKPTPPRGEKPPIKVEVKRKAASGSADKPRRSPVVFHNFSNQELAESYLVCRRIGYGPPSDAIKRLAAAIGACSESIADCYRLEGSLDLLTGLTYPEQEILELILKYGEKGASTALYDRRKSRRSACQRRTGRGASFREHDDGGSFDDVVNAYEEG